VTKKTIEQCFKQGQFRAALESLERLSPSAWRDTTQLRCLRAMGKTDDAVSLANQLHQYFLARALPYNTTRSERNHQRRYIALVFSETGRANEAISIMRPLVEHSPKLAALRREYAFALHSDGQFDLAQQQLREALLLQPSDAKTQAQLARLYCRSAKVQAGYDGYARASTLEPERPEYYEKLIYWSNYISSTTQQSNYQLTQLWAHKAYPERQHAHTHPNQPWPTANPNQQITLGLVSANLCAHTASFFIKPLLRGLNRQHFKVIAYSTSLKNDAVTTQIRSLCDQWRDSARLSDSELATQVRIDDVDVLLDLDGHSAGNRLNLFAQRAAPVQIAWLGYPATTGLKSMDFRISDRVADPIGQYDEFYSESLLRLPNGFICYEPLSTAPAVEPQQTTAQRIRFGSFCDLAKVSTLTLDSWAAVLRAVPNSTLYLKRQQLINDGIRHDLLAQFKRRGIDESRILTDTSKATIELHLAEYNKVDIALDTTPYNSKTTTCEALWMGVPVISLTGQTHASRLSASILHQIELDELAVDTLQGFADCAVQLSNDADKLASLKAHLRDRMRHSTLLDYQRFGRDVGHAVRYQWQHWCQQQGQQQGQKTEQGNPKPVAEVTK